MFTAIISGTTSEISGGKFANGAVTGAFVHMFNNMSRYMKKALGNPAEHPMETTIKPGYKKGLHITNQASAVLAVMHGIEGDAFLSIFWEGVNIISEGLLYMAGKKGILQQLRDLIKNNSIEGMTQDKKTMGYFMKEVLK